MKTLKIILIWLVVIGTPALLVSLNATQETSYHVAATVIAMVAGYGIFYLGGFLIFLWALGCVLNVITSAFER